MGIDYAAVSGYGFVLSHETDDLEAIAKNVGFDDYEQWDIDVYELAEFVCSKYDLNFVQAGDSVSGETCILIGDVQSVDIYGLAESPMPKRFAHDAELLTKLNNAIVGMGVPKEIAFYAGMHVY